jgi:ribonuclease HII
VDGNQAIPGVDRARQETVVGGDGRSASVAAASIVAKVTRDRMMAEYGQRYPGYEFSRHKGYPTRLHLERIRSLGLCDIHRRTFCDHLCGQLKLQLD